MLGLNKDNYCDSNINRENDRSSNRVILLLEPVNSLVIANQLSSGTSNIRCME